MSRYPFCLVAILTTFISFMPLLLVEADADGRYLTRRSKNAVDLSRLLSYRESSFQNLRPIEITQIDNSSGAVHIMMAMPPLRRDHPLLLSYPAEIDKEKEKALIRQHPLVMRSEAVLTVKNPRGHVAYTFKNSSIPSSKFSAGDWVNYVYAGVDNTTGLHRVDVYYAHDIPGSFLFDPENQQAIYIHTGSLAMFDKSKLRLVMLSDGANPTLSVLSARFKERPVGVDLYCMAKTGRNKPRYIRYLSGWHIDPYYGFDAVLIAENKSVIDGVSYEAFAIRFSRRNDAWHVEVSNLARFTEIVGMSCWQG